MLNEQCKVIMLKTYLTFDVEDFINYHSIEALKKILQLLTKYNLKGLFFITGHFSGTIRNDQPLLDSLSRHLIGYHSSSHSVRPIIPEFTDLEVYSDALEISYIRETSHIEPVTGEVKGEGGIKLLRELFPDNRVDSFRAPGYSWSPPHLEALYSNGIKFDFSTAISTTPCIHNGITFYPFQAPQSLLTNIVYLINSVVLKDVLVFNWHPDQFVNSKPFDKCYYKGNPDNFEKTEQLPDAITNERFLYFERFLKQISLLKKFRLVTVSPPLTESTNKLKKINLHAIYKRSIYWPKTYFSYNPKFIYNHMQNFFNSVQNVEI